MPRIVHLLDEEQTVQQVDLAPVPAIAWTLDPFAPVAEEYRHLVETPVESDDSAKQEDQE